MRLRNITIICLVILVIFIAYLAYAYNLPKWFPFNKENALSEWQEKIFKDRVLYAVEPKKEGGYLLAQSNKACSGLLYKIKFSPKEHPMISWKWRVIKFPQKNKTVKVTDGWIEKDDYAARVYVIFPSWYFMHIKSIEYIWDEDLPKGKILTSPYFNNIKLIVLQSGKKNINEWFFEERNIYEDYKAAFGSYPSASVGAIALMSDTDNTLSSAEAEYKDIKVGYKK